MREKTDIQKARGDINKFLSILKSERPLNYQPFKNEPKEYILSDGTCLFLYNQPGENPVGIVRRVDGQVFEIYGAIAKVYFSLNKLTGGILGNPITGERWLGSGPGRYQLFDSGIVKWDGGSQKMGGQEDVAHPVLFNKNPIKEGIEIECIVAFADIRGFTKWATKQKPEEIQELIVKIENIFQKHLAQPRFGDVFLKGTGDGFMVVCEKPSYKKGDDGLGFVCDFVNTNYNICNELVRKLDRYGLRVGFGIEIGQLKNVLILGRWDYLGDAVNNASKYQGGAKNKVVFSLECFKVMEKENRAWVKNNKISRGIVKSSRGEN